MTLSINIYRYNPEKDKFPYMQSIEFEKPKRDIMVLELLNQLKEKDPTISYRRSCREGVCGSDGMNINGKNGLACITPLSSVIKKNKLDLRPLPGLPVEERCDEAHATQRVFPSTIGWCEGCGREVGRRDHGCRALGWDR